MVDFVEEDLSANCREERINHTLLALTTARSFPARSDLLAWSKSHGLKLFSRLLEHHHPMAAVGVIISASATSSPPPSAIPDSHWKVFALAARFRSPAQTPSLCRPPKATRLIPARPAYRQPPARR